jgi:hypothetical protein
MVFPKERRRAPKRVADVWKKGNNPGGQDKWDLPIAVLLAKKSHIPSSPFPPAVIIQIATIFGVAERRSA